MACIVWSGAGVLSTGLLCHDITHVCQKNPCPCKGDPIGTLLQALKLILLRNVPRPSETRWTTVIRGLAFKGLCGLIKGMSGRAMNISLDDPALKPDVAKDIVTMAVGDAWKLSEGVRLKTAMSFAGLPSTLVSTVVGVLANSVVLL